MPRSSITLLFLAKLEPPREMGWLEAENRVTLAPFWAADKAVVRPDMPAPMMMMSSSMVSAI